MRFILIAVLIMLNFSCAKREVSKQEIQSSLGNLKDHINTCPTIITDKLDKIYGADNLLSYDCGYMKVPLFHERNSVEKLGLQFIYFYPTEGDGKNPVVMTQGGPGGSTINLLIDNYEHLEEIIKKQGLIVFEYRGTDFSDPNMVCKFYDPTDKPSNSEKNMKQCADYWREKFDLTAISTNQVAHDLAYLTNKIGFEKFHFYGVSYGTLVGQTLARLHPNRVSSLILDGIVQYGVDMNENDEIRYKTTMKNMDKNCQEDKFCKEVYGTVSNKILKVKDNLNRNPYIRPDLTIDGDVFFNFLNDSLFESSYVPLVHRLISKWQNKKLIELFVKPEIRDEIWVVYWSIYCNDYEMVRKKYNMEVKGEAESCKYWIPEGNNMQLMDLSQEAKNIPVLLLSGEYDPATPSYLGDNVEKEYNNAKHFIIKGLSHGTFFDSECIMNLVTKFIDNPQLDLINNCDLKTNFRPEFDESNALNISPAIVELSLNGWEDTGTSLTKDEEEISLYQYNFIGSSDEIFWLHRELLGGEDHPLEKESLSVNNRKWDLINSFNDNEKSQIIKSALLNCGKFWLGIKYLGDNNDSVEEIKTVIESIEPTVIQHCDD